MAKSRKQTRKRPTKGRATTPVRKRASKAKPEPKEIAAQLKSKGLAAPGRAALPKGSAELKPKGLAAPGRAAPPKGGAELKSKKKKRPAGVKSAGRAQPREKAKSARSKERTSAVSRRKAKPVKAKPAKPVRPVKAKAPRKRPAPVPSKKPPRAPKRLPPKKKRKTTPKPAKPTRREVELELARKRRNQKDRERRAEQKRQAELEAKRRKWKRKRKKTGGAPASPAIGWLRRILTHVREVFPCEMESTFPGGGVALDSDSDVEIKEQSGKSPWLVVGKFVPEEEVGYAELAQAFALIEGDLLLEADVHPDRMTQVRILFSDPKAKRGEGDAVISKVGGFSFVWSDLIGELVGSGDAESPDEDSLAGRYDETAVPTFYVFLSEQIIKYKTAWSSRSRTQEMRIK